MPIKVAVAIVLILLSLLAVAKDGGVPATDQSLESAVAERPSLAPVMAAFMASRQSQVSTRVFVTYDSAGNITEARVDPSTRDRNLDKAIRDWARKVKIALGATGGSGWFPIDMSKSH